MPYKTSSWHRTRDRLVACGEAIGHAYDIRWRLCEWGWKQAFDFARPHNDVDNHQTQLSTFSVTERKTIKPLLLRIDIVGYDNLMLDQDGKFSKHLQNPKGQTICEENSLDRAWQQSWWMHIGPWRSESQWRSWHDAYSDPIADATWVGFFTVVGTHDNENKELARSWAVVLHGHKIIAMVGLPRLAMVSAEAAVEVQTKSTGQILVFPTWSQYRVPDIDSGVAWRNNFKKQLLWSLAIASRFLSRRMAGSSTTWESLQRCLRNFVSLMVDRCCGCDKLQGIWCATCSRWCSLCGLPGYNSPPPPRATISPPPTKQHGESRWTQWDGSSKASLVIDYLSLSLLLSLSYSLAMAPGLEGPLGDSFAWEPRLRLQLHAPSRRQERTSEALALSVESRPDEGLGQRGSESACLVFWEHAM